MDVKVYQSVWYCTLDELILQGESMPRFEHRHVIVATESSDVLDCIEIIRQTYTGCVISAISRDDKQVCLIPTEVPHENG